MSGLFIRSLYDAECSSQVVSSVEMTICYPVEIMIFCPVKNNEISILTSILLQLYLNSTPEIFRQFRRVHMSRSNG